jgi:hypothetical protein
MEIFYKVYDLKNYEMALLFISLFVSFGLAGSLLFRFRFQRVFRLNHESNESINFVGQMIGVVYGILTGLIIVTAWEGFDTVVDSVADEAASIRSYQRALNYLNPSEREPLTMMNIAYVDDIIQKEWPAYARGDDPVISHSGLRDMEKMLYAISGKNENKRAEVSQALAKLERVSDARERRIETYINTGIPSVFWVILIAGAVMTLILTFFVHFESFVLQISLTTIYAIALGLVFFLMAAIDNPYRGEVHVSSEPYEALKTNLLDGVY